MKDYTRWKVSDFRALPHGNLEWADTVSCESVVLLPTRNIHDSGYRIIDLVPIIDGAAKFKRSGSCDVIHIDGIGGYGKWSNNLPTSVLPKGWSLDCLRGSGLFRLFSSRGDLLIGPSLSSVEVFGVGEDK